MSLKILVNYKILRIQLKINTILYQGYTFNSKTMNAEFLLNDTIPLLVNSDKSTSGLGIRLKHGKTHFINTQLKHCCFFVFLPVCLYTLGFPLFCIGREFDTFQSFKKEKISLGYYQGQAVVNDFGDLFTTPWKPMNSYIKTVFLAYKLDGGIRSLTFDTEGQIVKHEGLQDHLETNFSLVARLLFFKDILPTSIAYGQGLSYAMQKPELDKVSAEDSPQLLHYFLVEMALGLRDIPNNPRLIFRIHHRSGVFGFYCGDKCGSNIPVIGFRISL